MTGHCVKRIAVDAYLLPHGSLSENYSSNNKHISNILTVQPNNKHDKRVRLNGPGLLNETLIPQNSKTCFWGMSLYRIEKHVHNFWPYKCTNLTTIACDIIKLTHLFSFLYVRTCNSAYSIHLIFRYYDFIKDFWLINLLIISSSTSFEMNPEVKGTCAKETWRQPMYIPFTVKGCSERNFTMRIRHAMIFFKHSQALWRAPCCFGTNSYMI